jgi:putative ABC transport system permease protein
VSADRGISGTHEMVVRATSAQSTTVSRAAPSSWQTQAGIFWNDCRLALRSLSRARTFSLVAIITLALGIGASTAIFSVIDNILLNPFPYAGSDRFMVVMIHNLEDSTAGGREGFLGPEFLDYVHQNRVFDGVIGDLSDQDILYASRDGAQRLSGDFVTPNTFEFLGMPALEGRTLQPADYEPSAPPVFVLRYKTWLEYFNGDPQILNKPFLLNGTQRTLVGIMPPRFAFGSADVWMPQNPRPGLSGDSTQAPIYWDILAHLKPGITIPEAEADLNVLAHQLATVYTKEYPKNFTVQIQSLIDQVVGPFRTTLLIVLAAVILLLLIACSNVANLLVSRSTTREKEFATRAVLGASRWRIVRQLLIESFLLALCAAVVGCFLAWAGLRTLIGLTPADIIPAEASVRMNGSVLLFTLCAAAVTALLFGLVPALGASRRDFNDSLRDSGKGSGGGGVAHTRLRNSMVVLEVAVSLVLLIGAGLLMRSFQKIRQVDLGFQPDHILVTRIPLPEEHYKTAAQLAGFFRPLRDRLKALPGVTDATEVSGFPPYGSDPSEIEVPGKSHEEKWTAVQQLCGPGFFDILRVRFLAGRAFREDEVSAARHVAVINQAFQRKYFEGEQVVGRQIHLVDLEKLPDPVSPAFFDIIGVVADARNQGVQQPALPEVWIPYSVTGSGTRGILVRTDGDPLLAANTVRGEIWTVDRGVAPTSMESLEHLISVNSYAQPRFGFLLIAVFAGIGLILVTIGVYSVISYTTARRTREIGIRMALGAEPAGVERLVIANGLRLVCMGIALGLAGSYALSGIVASQLWGVSPHDSLTVVVVPAMILIVGVLACWIPARRATRVSPVVALRYE